MRGIRQLVVALVLFGGSFGRVRAESLVTENDGAPPGYQEAADLAVEEFAHGNYPEARARFLKAHAIWPNARSLRALGYCEYELKNYVAALAYLRAALASQVRPLGATQRPETEQLEQRTRGYVARYIVETVPGSAQLKLNGVDLALDAARSFQVAFGQYTLEASATGYQKVQRALQAEGGSEQTLRLELPRVVEAPAPVVTTTPAVVDRRDEEPLRKKWWLWTGVGAVVVAGVTAGLIAALHDPGVRDASGGNTGVEVRLSRP